MKLKNSLVLIIFLLFEMIINKQDIKYLEFTSFDKSWFVHFHQILFSVKCSKIFRKRVVKKYFFFIFSCRKKWTFILLKNCFLIIFFIKDFFPFFQKIMKYIYFLCTKFCLKQGCTIFSWQGDQKMKKDDVEGQSCA